MRSTPYWLAINALACCAQAQAATPQVFDIPAQPLSSALDSLASQSDLQLLYADDALKGKRSAPVKGSFTPGQALDKLMAGSGIPYTLSGNTVSIRPAGSGDVVQGTALSTVTVFGQHEMEDRKNYNAFSTSTATRTDTPLMDSPISVQTVTNAVIQDQQITRLEDAARSVSGVQPDFNFNGLYENFVIRGFSTNGYVFRNGYRLAYLTPETGNLDRIEFVKGPAAILYGRMEPGGLINMVTKRPQAEPYYALQQQFGSYDFYRTTLDATGPLGSDSLLYRFNIAYQDNNSFRDFISNEHILVAPSLTWNVNDDTQINLNFEYLNKDFVDDYGVPVGATGVDAAGNVVLGKRPANVPISRVYIEPGSIAKNEGWQLDVNGSHRFNENWLVRTGMIAWDRDYHWEEYPQVFHQTPHSLNRGLWFVDSNRNSQQVYLELNGHFDTFGARHDVLFGGDYFSLRESASGTYGFLNPPVHSEIDIFNPVYGQPTFGGYSRQDLRNLTATSPNYHSIVDQQWFGVYAQDQIKVTEQLHLLLGGRYDWATTRKSSADSSASFSELKTDTQLADRFTPRFGIVYQPVGWLSWYGNYVESLGFSQGRSLDGKAFKPQEGEQYETGIKLETPDGRLSANFAYFHILKNHILTTFQSGGSVFQADSGQARSQGLEVDITGKITDELSLIGTFAYTDVRLTKSLDPELQGNRLPNVPENAGSLWAKYDFGYDWLKGFSIGTGVYVASQRQGNAANQFQLPGYARWDAMAAYRFNVGKARLTTQFNVYNILDKTYYKSANNFDGEPTVDIAPGEPLTFMGSVRLEY